MKRLCSRKDELIELHKMGYRNEKDFFVHCDLRMRCLEVSVKIHSNSRDVIDGAKVFENYVLGRMAVNL